MLIVCVMAIGCVIGGLDFLIWAAILGGVYACCHMV